MSSQWSSPTESSDPAQQAQMSSSTSDRVKGRFSRPHATVRFILTTLLALILIVGAASPFIAVQYQKQVFAERVHTYLIEQKHYKPEQIVSIQGIWGIMLPSFYVKVIFKDEPNRVYTYFAHAEIMQQSHRLIHATYPDQSNDSGAKHAEEPI